MASFTDNIPTFNPYVSQQPVESMVQVGMMKQQQYDTNLTKIYQSMNKIAGLDIIRDVDQEHLKGRMNEVSDDLKVYAAGDFSQNNLTRKVNSMVNSVAKDDKIIAAVQSTAKVRAELAKMTKAQEKGESSVVNEWALNKDINKWMEGTEAGESFSGAWTPYTDVDAKLREVYESMDETDITIEDPFQRDMNGNTLYFDEQGNASTDPTQGEKRVDHAMLKKSVKGKSAEKILNNFYTSLSADELRQLDLNAQYHHRGSTAETFAPAIKEAGEVKKEFYKNSIKQIAVELETNTNLTAEEKEELSKKAKEYQLSLDNGDIDKEVAERIESLKDPATLDSVKSSTYIDQYLRNMALNLETESVSIEYKNNPYFDADMKIKNYNMRVREFNNKVEHQNKMYELALRKQLLDEAKEGLTGAGGRVRAGDPSTEVDNELFEYNTLVEEQEQFDEDIRRLGLRTLPLTQVEALLGANATEEEKLQALDEMFVKFKGGELSDNAHLNKYFKQREELERQKGMNTILMEGAEKAAQSVTDKIDDLADDYSGYTINGVHFSFREIMNFKAAYSDPENRVMVQEQFANPAGPPTTVNISRANIGKLSKQFAGTKEEILLNAMYNYDVYGEETPEGTMRDMWGDIQDIGKDYRVLKEQRDTVMTDYIKEHSYKNVAKKETLDMGDKNNKRKVDTLIAESAEMAETIGGVDVYDEDTQDYTVINAMRKDPNTAYTIEKMPDGTGALTLTNKAVGEKQVIPLSGNQLGSYFPRTIKENPLEEALSYIRATGGTSNTRGIIGVAGASTALYDGNDFPSVAQHFKNPEHVKFDILGDLDNTGDPETDAFNLVIYVKHPEKNVWVMERQKQFINLASVYARIIGVNKYVTDDILKKNYKKQKPVR